MNKVKPIPLGKADVIKRLISLSSGNKAEAIYFLRPEKQVICISTQISCNIGCLFCASPNKGKTYNLTPEEIMHQIHSMSQYLDPNTPLLISFMGEGEPLANYNSTLQAMRIAEDVYPCRMAVSTVGLNLRKFSRERFKVPMKVQVSVHTIARLQRKMLLPAAPGFPTLMRSLTHLKEHSNMPIDLNFTLVAGINDRQKDLLYIIKYFKQYHIKISKLNYVKGLNLQPSTKCQEFVNSLIRRGISAEYHETDGGSKLSACGQTSGVLV